MRRPVIGLLAVMAITALLNCPSFASEHTAQSMASAPPPPALDSSLGSWHWAINTKVPDAQKYFDQGMRLMYGFNPEEAERAFREAARLDPGSAMCRWGVALSNGNNFNVPRLPWRDSTEYAETQTALKLKEGASPKERALIDALATRTSMVFPAKPEDASALDKAYADAMRKVAKTYASDMDVQVLFAESLMDMYPWHLWTPDGKPSPVTPELVATLERVLKTAPNHPGANHYYIHAMEMLHPEKAVASADRLRGSMPDAGHMVHMPSHIYARVGRYEDAVQVNRDAVKVDEAYFTAPTAGMLYTPYLAHNRQFVSFVAMIQGRWEESVKAGHAAATTIPLEMFSMMPGMDFFNTSAYAVQIQFGKWDEILAEPPPPASLLYTDAYWHFARGMAFNGKGDMKSATAERDSLKFLHDALAQDAIEGQNSARSLLEIAQHTLEGAMARGSRDLPGAIRHFQDAAKIEDGLVYDEPPDWLLFPRQDLGNALLESGRAAEAEQAFRGDLAKRSENGWALNGLERSLRAQKKDAEADKVAGRFQKAWSAADTKISAAY